MRRDVRIEDDYANHKLSIIFPRMCSICQDDTFQPSFLVGVFVKGDSKGLFMESVFQCTNLKCNSLIIGYYKRVNNHVPFELIKVSPVEIKEKNFNPEIKEVSPRFVHLYNQLFIAEEKKIDIILGIGYRKAFEFLLKDFLVYIDPKVKEKLVDASLIYCLNKIDNKNISVISNKVPWLGNEEDLFTRQWTGKDINDLKKMIDVTSSYITANIRLKKHMEKLNE
jgi:hypothetical protein